MIKKSWAFRVVLIALMLIAIEIPPIVVNFAIHYAKTSQLAVYGFMILFICLMLAIIWWARRTYHTYNQLGSPAGIKIRWIIGGYLAIIVGMDILSFFNQLIYHQTETANNAALGSMLGHSPIITVIFVFSAVILSPIAEELIFRGTLTNMFFRRGNIWPKAILSGIVFSTGHMSTNPISFIIYAYMGLILALVYLKTGDIRNSIAVHIINNSIAMYVLLMQVS
ncbi:CPBP family intramembrane metalloprotease [Limosilactobacillus sp. STM2_1]|uniref:CPBP family intramembrane metalloprotease n=1 Tax=Limosilactobacillus rudii TaxID=2759755 RepID=A0A7W3YME1_9LACO|nr:type II CAAX endopeptidase family protein [Limosilactobacillus rudii]MBB1080062.1 CPBP family intramembrane metalloprotease [Limosilactobacillus rudii]MBB1096450.1 CPBP family intramembrane metalloprotease [Limosilactobacillus rudii]